MLAAVSNGLQSFISPNDTNEEENLFHRFKVDTKKKYGEGGYGATYAAQDQLTQQRLAVKIIDTRRMKIEAIRKECQILDTLDHPNVIKLKAHGTGPRGSAQVMHAPAETPCSASYPDTPHLTHIPSAQAHLYFIFMELAGGGELFDQVIDRGTNAMPEDVARNFFVQMLAGVTHCHERGVAHRDLKLENVLLTSDGVVKIIDFGLSHVYVRNEAGEIDRSKPLTDMCGSKSYAAPEVLGAKSYDGFAADVWSLGVSLFAMLSGFFPLDEATPKDWRYAKLVEAQQMGRSTSRTVYSWYKRTCNHLSTAIVDLLDGMLTIDAQRRLTMKQIVEHPWTRGPEAMAALEAATSHPLKGLDQGMFDPSSEVMDSDGPRFRSAVLTGAGVAELMALDEADDGDAMPVYRSIGGMAEEAPLAMPLLGRQNAFSRYF